MKHEYIVRSPGPLDKHTLVAHIDRNREEFQFPCKVVLRSPDGARAYYVELSNVKNGYFVIDWDNIYDPPSN